MAFWFRWICWQTILNHQFKKDFFIVNTSKQINITNWTKDFALKVIRCFYNCAIMLFHRKLPEAKQIVFLENLIKNKAEKNESHDSVEDHYLQKSSFACGKRRVGFFHEVSPGAWNDTKYEIMSQEKHTKHKFTLNLVQIIFRIRFNRTRHVEILSISQLE